MAFILPRLSSKREIDRCIKESLDKLLVLRFGRETDVVCMQLDEILWKTQEKLSRMADIYTVDVDSTPLYVQYFDITLIPATIFFFNGQHIKVDYGTADHTKFIGSFKTQQDFIDLVEVVLRGVLNGKLIVSSPIDPRNVPKYTLLYKDI